MLDAGVVIALLDADDAHHRGVRRALEAARSSDGEFVLPASAIAEVLVGPIRRDAASAELVEAFVDALPARVEPASRAIARSAAGLRARHARLRLPDALVVATALVLSADRVITTDEGWPELGIPIEIAREPEPEATNVAGVPKPRSLGTGASGATDTARRAGDEPPEPRKRR